MIPPDPLDTLYLAGRGCPLEIGVQTLAELRSLAVIDQALAYTSEDHMLETSKLRSGTIGLRSLKHKQRLHPRLQKEYEVIFEKVNSKYERERWLSTI